MPAEMSYCEVYLIPRSVTALGWVSLRLSSSQTSWKGIRTSRTSRLFLSPYRRCLPGHRSDDHSRCSLCGCWVTRSQGQEFMCAQSGCVRQAYGKRGAIRQTTADQIDLFTGIRSELIRKPSSAFVKRI